VRGYLLDTMIVRYWFDQQCPEHSHVIARIAQLPEGTPLRISTVTLGEIEFGHRAVATHDTEVQSDFNAFLSEQLPVALAINRTTTAYYGAWRARLFDRFAPKKRRGKKTRPEQLVDPSTGRELGIDENDLWIASQAMEHNLVLVTHDAMDRIRLIMDGSLHVRFEDWAKA